MIATLISIAGLLFIAVIVLVVLLVTGRRTPTVAQPVPHSGPISDAEPVVAEGFTQISTEVLDKLHADIAELNRVIGEERAAHRAKLVEVQSQALADVTQARNDLQLEFSEKKRTEAKATAARSRTALVAKISEHIAPLLAGFPYNFKEARWFGEIFDFLVFEGLEEGYIRNVVFVEVKTRRSGSRVSNPRERMLKDAIEGGRVRYEVFVPDVRDAKATNVDS